MIRPIRDKILVKPRDQKETTNAGIYIPVTCLTANNNMELVVADVVAVGEGQYDNKGNLVPLTVKVGDVILYGGRNYSGVEIEEDGVKYRVLKNADILCVVEEE